MADKKRLPPAGLELITKQGHKSFGGAGQEYSLEEVLGEGSYGSVYRCLRVRDFAVFAVKIIDTMRIGFVGGDVGIQTAEIMASREVDALRQLSSHPGVIRLEAAFFSEATRQIFIVTDFVTGGHLFAHVVQRTAPLREPEASHIVAQLSDAISFCHALGVVHRDLKLENVLVASVNFRLAEQRNAETGFTEWQTEELFSVKICDFGFAKSLAAFTTRTPIGTGTYAAPEVRLRKSGKSGEKTNEDVQFNHSPMSPTVLAAQASPTAQIPADRYDAFKADSFSLGVMLFVMLCLAFPSKDRVKSKNSHRLHKSWAALSIDAQSVIDGLLEVDPEQRLSIIQVCHHQWVKLGEEDESPKITRRNSKQTVLSNAETEWSSRQNNASEFVSYRSPQPRWRHQPEVQDPALPGVIASHRALVHIQQERGIACWALTGAPGLGGISCLDQLQWHVQLTEKRIHEAKALLSNQSLGQNPAHTIDDLFSYLAKARKLAVAAVQPTSNGDAKSSADSIDSAFVLYNQACAALIEIVAKALEAVRPGSPEGRRAARRYRLFSAAAEQLGRERAFICGHGQQPQNDFIRLISENCAATGASFEAAPSTRLHRLAEIIGARKILLGTVVDGSSDVVATSEGLLGTLIGDDEPSLLSPGDIAKLESLEQRVLKPSFSDPLPMEEWYQTITRFLKEIHSRIAINLVEDTRLPELLPEFNLKSHEDPTGKDFLGEPADSPNGHACQESEAVAKDENGCRAGLKRLLQSWLDRL